MVADAFIADLIGANAARTPGALAVECEDRALTWRALVEKSTRGGAKASISHPGPPTWRLVWTTFGGITVTDGPPIPAATEAT